MSGDDETAHARRGSTILMSCKSQCFAVDLSRIFSNEANTWANVCRTSTFGNITISVRPEITCVRIINPFGPYCHICDIDFNLCNEN